MKKIPKLAVAFDFENRTDVFSWCEKLKGMPIVVKLGLGILPRLTEDDLKLIKSFGFEFFADMKLHDIPSQVERAVRFWIGAGAKYLTIHCGGGSQMMESAVAVRNALPLPDGTKTQLLGVTLLTSLSDTHVRELGFHEGRKKQIETFVNLSLKSGLSGFVSPARFVPEMRALAQSKEQSGKGQGSNFFACTPGIALTQNEIRYDQPDLCDVKTAVNLSSDLLVVGRSVLQSIDPRSTVETILNEIQEVSGAL